MADPTKTSDIAVLTHQNVVHPDTKIGSEIDVTAVLRMRVVLYHALVEAVANTNPGIFYIQGTPYATGGEGWHEIASFVTSTDNPATEALTATEPAAEKVLAVASTTGFAARNVVYIQDTTTIADSEWGQLEQIVANTSLDLVDGLTNGKDSADVAWGSAEIFSISVPCGDLKRLRVVYSHEGAAGANADIKGLGITEGYQ